MSAGVDHAGLAIDLLRALRGRRTQRAFSQRLGYRSNIAYRWESGQCWPTGVAFFQAMRKLGHKPDAAMRRFRRDDPGALSEVALGSRAGISALLCQLRGNLSVAEVARRTGYSRHQLTRWLHAAADPRLPELLRLLDVLSLRLVDFACALFPVERLPSLARAHAREQALRQAAYDRPWSHAVLRALELDAYRALPKHQPGWIAARIGISLQEEQACLSLLQRAGQVRRVRGRLAVRPHTTVDVRQEPERTDALRAFWLRESLHRLQAQSPGIYSYYICSLSDADLQRVRLAHERFYREVQAIVDSADAGERVALVAGQVLALDAEAPSGGASPDEWAARCYLATSPKR